MPLPPTVATVNPKGGTGKTTIAVHLAVAACRASYRIALLDADPQGSVLEWQRRTPADYDGPFVDRLGQGRTLAAAIGQTDAQMVVIDSPAGLGGRTRRVLINADLALVPVRPSGLDLWGTNEFLEVLDEYVDRGLTAAFVISQKDPRSSLSDRLTDELRQHGIPLLNGLASRVAYARSMYEGQTVLDGYDPKAAREVLTLLDEVGTLLS
jgi:chromosome partitioning protein